MSATALFSLSCTVQGLPEASTAASGVGFQTSWQTTQAVCEWRTTVVTTVAANMPVINPPTSVTAIFLKAVDSTNPHPFRVQPTTSTALSGVGFTLSSVNPSFIAVSTGTNTTFYLWTTATSGAGAGAPSINVRVGLI